MKTYNKAQFIEEFCNKKFIAFIAKDSCGTFIRTTEVKNTEYIKEFIEWFPNDAKFDVFSYSAGMSNHVMFKRLSEDHFYAEYGDYISFLKALEDNGGDIFVVYIPNFYSLQDDVIARQYPYEVTAEMIRRALGKSCCKMLDLRAKKVRGVYQWVDTPHYIGRANYATRQEARAAVEQEVKEYQSYIRGVLRRCKEIDTKGLSLEEGVNAWFKYQKQLKKEQEKEQKAREKAKEKARKVYEAEQKQVSMMINGNYSVDGFLDYHLRTGDHTYKHNGHIADENNIICYEDKDFDGYSRSCSFPMIRRQFVLNIKRGYRVCIVGGLITFYKGGVNRQGMKVDWIEQGRSIADITKHTGYLVRGEHIEAKSLREAVRINEEHRAMKLARILSKRKRAERREEEKKNGSLKITFADSLNAGNCRPGTQEFKNKYEEAIGHKATSISIADLRKYAKQFGVEYYAEQAIEYALNH